MESKTNENNSKECRKLHKGKYVKFQKSEPRDSSASSESESQFLPFMNLSKRRKTYQEKRGDLMRIFEKQRLKDKSLSRKMKTPFHRKLNRTCWPIEMGKVCKIKKKPREKRKSKPNNRSLRKRKFSKPTFMSTNSNGSRRRGSESDAEVLEGESFNDFLKKINTSYFLYTPVTPQMLMDVLNDSEYLKSGATLDSIIAKLKLKIRENKR